MRYSVILKGLTISQLEAEAKRCGARNLRIAPASKQIFCDLDDGAVIKLRGIGCSVNKVGGVKTDVIPPIVSPPVPVAAAPVYSPEELIWATGLEDLRGLTEPPLYGEGMNLAIIDTGIRGTHQNIKGRIIYEKNYTTDEMRDGFSHGTGIASIILAVAPQCSILNLKVLNDKGEGTEEEVAIAIDDCITMFDTNPDIAPTVINLSLGGPDDGNPSNPLRVACRAAIEKGIWIHASAGNGGPLPYSITCPACEKYVLAVGSAKYYPEASSFIISDFSSRGPTLEGLTKPEIIMFGEDISVASSDSDTATTAKSGTSFATPFCSAMVLLYHEACFKWVAYEAGVAPGILPRGAIDLEKIPIPIEMMVEEFFPRICVKPAGVAAGKDNNYGNGIPLGSLVYQAFTAVSLVDISTIMQQVMPLIGLVLMGMILAPMLKGVK